MNIAIIPARGGSKRLPGKNIKLLAGKPMIVWTIEAALESGVFDHVFVSTDSKDIAHVAIKAGASVPFIRPQDLATDEATTNDVVTHLVEWLENSSREKVITVAILQPTSPLRNAHHIREAANLMKDKSASAVVSVCELEYPIQFCNKLGPNGSMDGFVKPYNIKRTQELDIYYRLNGAIYIFDRKYVGCQGELYSETTYPYIMNAKFSVDIDTEDDFDLTYFYMSNYL